MASTNCFRNPNRALRPKGRGSREESPLVGQPELRDQRVKGRGSSERPLIRCAIRIESKGMLWAPGDFNAKIAFKRPVPVFDLRAGQQAD